MLNFTFLAFYWNKDCLFVCFLLLLFFFLWNLSISSMRCTFFDEFFHWSRLQLNRLNFNHTKLLPMDFFLKFGAFDFMTRMITRILYFMPVDSIWPQRITYKYKYGVPGYTHGSWNDVTKFNKKNIKWNILLLIYYYLLLSWFYLIKAKNLVM